jgi:hypothetical protein
MELPVEIWFNVVEHLPSSQQRICLSVSRLFHDLAVHFLFSVVKIYILSSGGEYAPPFYISHDQKTLLSCRSWEILDCIVEDPKFARAVKKVVVYAHVENDRHVVFERRKSFDVQ